MIPRQFTTVGLTAAVVVGSLWLLLHSLDYSLSPTRGFYPPHRDRYNDSTWYTSSLTSLPPRRRKNIAIASSFPYHFDVYMAAAKTIGDVLDSEPEEAEERGSINLFTPNFGFGFDDIVEELGLWRHRGTRGRPEELVNFINADRGASGIDLIVFGTCEVDLGYWHDELVMAWDQRDAEHKFKIVCIVHNVEDTRWQVHITHWARRDAIRLLPIADHVKNTFRDKFNAVADSSDPGLYTAGYQHIPIDVHVPILEIPHLPTKHLPRQLVHAVIQGTLVANRRDYLRFFDDLIASLHEDAAAWGYLPLNGRASFEPDFDSSRIPPFQLLLVGAGGIEIPAELAFVATVHHDLAYKDFYTLVASADIVVPAFAQFGYFRDQASSTVALATELAVPLLVTERLRRTYGYIDDPRAVVTRPAAMSEVQALKALRTGDVTAFLNSDPAGVGVAMGDIKGVREAVDLMLKDGWVRDRGEWMEWRQDVWERNWVVVDRILRDMP
ncbi:hypothetical protein V8D89_005597 [Ganoderma adspersum]